MKSDKPILQSFLSTAVIFGIAAGILLSQNVPNPHYRLTYTLLNCLFPGIVTALWSYNDKQSWPWWRFPLTVLGLAIAFTVLKGPGKPNG